MQRSVFLTIEVRNQDHLPVTYRNIFLYFYMYTVHITRKKFRGKLWNFLHNFETQRCCDRSLSSNCYIFICYSKWTLWFPPPTPHPNPPHSSTHQSFPYIGTIFLFRILCQCKFSVHIFVLKSAIKFRHKCVWETETKRELAKAWNPKQSRPKKRT